MSPVIPMLARAAAFGAVIGIGGECVTDFEADGALFAVSVITSVALRAIAYLFSAATAVGVVIGYVVCCIKYREVDGVQMLGYMILGGALGYMMGPVLAGLS